jgi:ribonuclease HI
LLPPKTIAEIVGFNHNKSLFIRQWYTTVPVAYLNTATDVTRSHPRTQRGAATTTLLTPTQALGSHPRRVFLGPPSRNNNQRHSISLITPPTTYSTELHIIHKHPLPEWLTPTILDNISQLGPYDIFTDGSWLDSGPAWNHITHNSPAYTGTAGLVLISQADNWMDLPIITLHLYNGTALDATSAYSMELISVVTALYLLSIMDSTATIFSDCQSVINKITKLQKSTTALRATTADSTLLTTALHHLQNKKQQLRWIKGHPERTQPDEALWTREMWGNHLADRTASNALHTPSYQYNNNSATILHISNIPPIDIAKLSPTLSPSNHWYLGKTSRQYTSRSLIDSIHINRLNAYLITRDEYRAKAELPPLWQNLNIPLASELWQLTTNTTNRSLCNRLLFDKHWHGRNQAKAIKDDPVLHALTSKCPLCVCSDSVQHWTTQCSHPRAQSIRKETISKLRQQVRATAQLFPAHASTIHYFGTDYLSLVTGPNSAPDIWRGLWTPNQLNTFSSSYYQFIPAPIIKPLKKLFLQLGRTLTSSCITLWIARQKTIYELVEYMHMHPHQDYHFPTYTHNFPNSKDMPPLSADQLNTLRKNATELQPAPIIKISLYTTNRKLRTPTNTNIEQTQIPPSASH